MDKISSKVETVILPIASVIIPTFNRSKILRRALESVLGQTLENFEILVVDDGGEDDSRKVVVSYGDSRIRYIRRQNGGISAARNTGIAEARAPWITFLDDDDEALPGWLSAFDELLTDPSVGIACVGALLRHKTKGSTEVVLPRRLKPVYERAFGLFRGGTFASRTSLLREVGGFAEKLRCSHATELAMRLIPACHGHGMIVKSCSHPYIQINREEPQTRMLRRPAHLLEGTTYILQTHSKILKRSPDSIARYLAIAGVAAVRLGRYNDCRKFFFKSLLAHPWSIKPYLRLLASLNQNIARRVWRFPNLDIDAV